MKRVQDVPKRHRIKLKVLKKASAYLKKLKVLEAERKELERVLNARRYDISDEEKINDKVREIDRQIQLVCREETRRVLNDISDEDETSMASSSNSERSEDESSSSSSNGEEEHTNMILGQGGNGQTNIDNTNASVSVTFRKVIINKKSNRSRKRRRKE